jgi:hypothetical protein
MLLLSRQDKGAADALDFGGGSSGALDGGEFADAGALEGELKFAEVEGVDGAEGEAFSADGGEGRGVA